MRGYLPWLALVAGLAANGVVAQQVPPPASAPVGAVLTVKQDVLFDRSAFGRASLARLEEASRRLVAENRRIEAALEEEERDLTNRRPNLPSAEFRALSEAFDRKVEGIRAAQDAKSRDLSRQHDEDRRTYFEAALPVLAEIMQDAGAVALLDQSNFVLSLERIDITEAAIARMDVLLPDLPAQTPDQTGTPEQKPPADRPEPPVATP